MATVEERLIQTLGSDRCVTSRDRLLAWECDGFTMHKALPRAVALPETTAEMQTVVQLLAATDTPFVPRGAGTCLSGGPTPAVPAVVLETSRMNRVLEVLEQDRLAVVEPGVVNLDLSRQTAVHGLHYAPDPSSQTVCTIGGNLAENSGGPHCFKYGMTTDHVVGATVVLPDGTVATLGSGTAPRHPGGLDLLGVFTGSEGTFGIATEITVRLCPDPEAIHTILAAFVDVATACAAVSDIVAAGLTPAALEILDAATIAAVEASVFAAGYPTEAGAVLLIELDGTDVAVGAETEAVLAALRPHRPLMVEEAADAAARARLWKGRKGAFGAMGRLKPDLYVLDGVVPRTRLVETLAAVAAIGAKHGVMITNVFHAGDGNIHPNIPFDGRDKDERTRVVAAGHDILKLCMSMGGSITGEHGVGSEKLDHVDLMFDPDDLEVMARVRAVFDPKRLCNPGKAIPERHACGEVARWPQLVQRVLEADSQDHRS